MTTTSTCQTTVQLLSNMSGCVIRRHVFIGMMVLFGASAPCMASQKSSEGDIHTSRILPETVYLERRGDAVRLNFDIEIVNETDRDQEIVYVEFKAFDADGHILTRRQMGGNGLPGPIAMLPSRTIPAGSDLYLFNPFPDFRTDGDIKRITIEVFYSEGSVTAEIEPQPAPGPFLERPPLDGLAFVYAGNDLLSHHRRVSLNSEPAKALGMERLTQRFAIDLTMLDPQSGDLVVGDLSSLSNFPAYGAAIAAPADSEVIAIRSSMPDNVFDENGAPVKPETYESFGADASLGNYVILKIEDAYLVMSHFQDDSIAVREGDKLRAGDPLGRLGFSGDTAYPHLHMQLQDGPDPLHARPLPIVFECAGLGAGARAARYLSTAIDSGDFVRPCKPQEIE
ncbi:MAG: M23 family metallopeptidase [Hyphococcus sp.]